MQLLIGDVVYARMDLSEEIYLDLLSSGYHDERVGAREDADICLQRLLDEISAAKNSIRRLAEAGHEK